ncbi:tape measure protein [Xanthobacter flavus]|uniref:tape measure protein n=1 Tax=Xanthobacter flavus TaxID=281 RepID=UPI003728FD50
MAPTNREILFVLKFRNLARQALTQFASSMKAGATGTNAAAAATANLHQNARKAAQAVNNVARNTRAVSGGGFGGMARALRHANDQANGLSQTLMRLAGLAVTAFAGGKVIEQADDYNTLISRLRLVTDSQDQLNDTYEKLFQSAQNNRVALGSTVELYARLANSAADLNLNQGQLLQITDSVSKALTVGGGNALANAATLLQLGQAFGAGALRGDELNSVLEQTPRLAQAIADGLKVPVGSLKSLAEQGKVTSEAVANALLSQKDALDREFLAMNKTVSSAWAVLGNAVLDFIGKADNATGASTSFAENILKISDMVRDQSFMKAGAVAVDLFGQGLLALTKFAKDAIGAISSVSTFLRSGTTSAELASAALAGVGISLVAIAAASAVVSAALSVNPVALLAGAAVALVATLYQLRNATIGWGNDTVRIGDLASAAWEKLVGWVSSFSGIIKQAWDWVTTFTQSIGTYFSQIGTSSGSVLSSLVSAVSSVVKTLLNYWMAYAVSTRDIIVGLGRTMIEAVTNIARELYAKLSALAQGMAAGVRGDFTAMGNLLAQALSGGIKTGVEDNLSGIADKVKENFRTDYVDNFATVVIKTLEDLKSGSIKTLDEVHARAKEIEAARQRIDQGQAAKPEFKRNKQVYDLPLNGKIQEEIEKLKAETRLIGLNEEARARLQAQIEIEKIARQESVKDVQKHVDAYLKEYDALQRLKQAYQDNPWNGLKDGMDQFAQSASKLADNVASAWNTAINGVGDTLADMILKRKADFNSLVGEFAKQMLSAGIKNAMGNVIKGFTGQSPTTIQAPTATVNAGTVTIAGVTGQIGGLSTNSVASIANGAIPVGGSALTGLASSRSAFSGELSNPAVLSQLYAMTRAEVGGQGPEAQQAFMESIFNRASARGMSLEQTLGDKNYFPQSTFDAANRYASQSNPVTYDELLNKVREGSNISGFATGNASGTVGFAGGPMTYASGGERFGIEGPDKAWARQMEEMTRVQQTGSEQQIAQAQQAQQQLTQITQTGSQQQVQQAQQAQQQITSSYQQTAQQAQTLTPQFGQMGQNLSQLVGPLANVVPGLGQFSGALQQVLSFLLKGLGSFGGMGGGSIGLFHTGGVVGGPASAYRKVHMAAFAHAQRYHNGGFAGFKPNEVPAILKRRERVLTEAENKNYENLRARQADGIGALSAAMQPVADRLNVALGGISVQVEGGSSGDRKKDADFANDIAEKVSLATEKQVLGILMNQQRPGCMLYKGRTNK